MTNSIPANTQILSFYDRTRSALLPWDINGFTTCSVDLLEQLSPGTHIKSNVLDIETIPKSVKLILMFPPCTNFAVSGARWWKDKGDAHLIDLIHIKHAINIAGDIPFILENPIGRLFKYIGNHNCIINPFDFTGYSDASEHYSKSTCLWLKNGAREPVKNPGNYEIIDGYIHRLGSVNYIARQKTPLGLAYGIYEANKKLEFHINKVEKWEPFG